MRGSKARGIRTVWGLAALCAGLVATEARAQDARPWAGEWRVEGDAGARRRLERDADGLLRLTAVVRGLDLELRGQDAAQLHLAGELTSTRGLVGALQDDEPGATHEVRLTGDRLATNAEGEEQARITIAIDGKDDIHETWLRPGAPGLAWLEAPAAKAYDFKHGGPLRLRFEVRGRAQVVRLRVKTLAPQHPIPVKVGDRHQPLEAQTGFYRDQGLTDDVVYEEVVAGGAPLRLGPHVVSFAGRDRTGAKRLLLGGGYRVELETVTVDGGDAAELPRVEAPLQVAQPRYTFASPLWPALQHPDTGEWTRPISFRASNQRLLDQLVKLPGGFDVQRIDGWNDDVRVMDRAFESSAGVSMATHGQPGGYFLALVNASRGSIQTVSVRQDPRRAEAFAGPPRPGQRKPFRDLQAVFIFACNVGRKTAEYDYPAELIGLGADLVVSFYQPVRVVAYPHFQEGLGERIAAGGSLGEAIVAAVNLADTQTWDVFNPNLRLVMRGLRKPTTEFEKRFWAGMALTPLRESVRIDAAPGIDPLTERMFPPRYGNSTN